MSPLIEMHCDRPCPRELESGQTAFENGIEGKAESRVGRAFCRESIREVDDKSCSRPACLHGQIQRVSIVPGDIEHTAGLVVQGPDLPVV